MQINKEAFVKGLSGSIICPKDFGLEVDKTNKTCGYSVDCQTCWNKALDEVNIIELIGGTTECRK